MEVEEDWSNQIVRSRVSYNPDEMSDIIYRFLFLIHARPLSHVKPKTSMQVTTKMYN